MSLTYVVAFVVYLISVGVYRLYFHPLSRFPGPKLAAVSSLYEFYYNVLRDGVYVWEIERMHRKYGPIIRINPHEIHIDDAAFYNEIYTNSPNHREKYWSYVKGIALPQSVVSTVGHNHHAMRRKFLSNFFSKQAITAVEPLVQEHIDRAINLLQKSSREGRTVNLSLIFHAITIDVISHYAYGEDYQSLDMDDLHGELRKALLALTSLFHLMRFLPFDATFLEKIPIPLLRVLIPSAAELLLAKKRIRTQAKNTLGGKVASKKQTVFTALMNPELPPAERSLQRLQDDGFLLLQAGSETTGQALSVLMFYVLRDATVLKKVKTELREVMPDVSGRPSVTDLQALPYFSAVITEGMRLSFGTLTRLPRVAPNDAIRYGDWSIPAGTPVSQTAYLIHTNPEIFPDPQRFNPDRWIDAGENRKHLESILVNFSKGRRQCLGINLAQAEIYLAAAHILRRVDMTLLDTDVDKIKPHRDRVIILPQKGYYDIGVTINGVEVE